MTHTHNVTRRRCCWLSLLIGGPVGLMIVFVGLIILLNKAGEMESAMGILGAYVDAIVGLLVALIPALWWAGRRSYAGLVAGESLLMVSFGYSVFVNTIIWLAFMGMAVIQNFSDFSWALLLPGLIL